MDVHEYYKAVYSTCGSVIEFALKDKDVLRDQAIALNYLADLKLWRDVLANRYEHEVLDGAIREYQFSLLALLFGQYRQAFAALRLSFELSLAAIMFSAHELHFREWQAGRRDINWGALISENDGILSKNFVKAFFPSLDSSAPHYRALSERVYRECSEYVHGNAVTHRTLPKDIEFSKHIFESWHEKAEAMRLVVTYSFVARYLNFLVGDDKERLSHMVLERLGHLEPVRTQFAQ